ncbi:MAG: SirB1 family protein [Candidatus Promineifilaceae bacterium]
MSLSAFQRELQRDPLDLARTALLFANGIAFPNLDIEACLNSMGQIAERAKASRYLDCEWQDRPAQLARYLYEEERFQGNSAAYHEPENSFLNVVLTRRLGIPISLSAVYLAIAKTLNLDAFGIGLPGHFIVGVRQELKTVYIDPFYGRELTQTDCSHLVRATTGYRGDFRLAWLQPTSDHNIVLRMLNNLRLIYMHQQRWQAAKTVLAHLEVIRPNFPDIQRDRGLIAFAAKDYATASQHLDRYLGQNPNASDAPMLKKTVGSAIAKWAKRN